MRAVFALAAFLGTTAAAVLQGMSAQEFTRWQLWMAAEQQGSEWAALRHAELMAAVHNGPHVKHATRGSFAPADFMRADPWAVKPRAADKSPEQMAAEHARLLAEWDG